MGAFDEIPARAIRRRRRILFSGPSPATREAVSRATRGGAVEPVLLPDRVPGDTSADAAAAAVRAGLAAGWVAGAAHPPGDALRAARRVLSSPERIPFSFVLAELARPTEAGDPVLALADAGWVASPDARHLAEIACATAAAFERAGFGAPVVALLSFSTHGSAQHRSIDVTREALALARDLSPGLPIDGELQGDAALASAVGSSKAPGSAVAGRANVLVFPGLDAARTARGLLQTLGGARISGPYLGGLDRPVALPATEVPAEIELAAAITSLLAG